MDNDFQSGVHVGLLQLVRTTTIFPGLRRSSQCIEVKHVWVTVISGRQGALPCRRVRALILLIPWLVLDIWKGYWPHVCPFVVVCR